MKAEMNFVFFCLFLVERLGEERGEGDNLSVLRNKLHLFIVLRGEG